ncbi:MAG: FAD-dependent oxidoreductase [Patescibacteria group bacterium]|jgi:ferredoxin-NADP reductase
MSEAPKAVTASYTVSNTVQLASNGFALRLDRKSGKRFAYNAGQFAMVTVTDKDTGEQRTKPLSFSSTPTDPDMLEFGYEKRGYFTQALSKLKAGDVVTLRAPLGFFTYPDTEAGPLVLLAGGTGIAPIMGMLRSFHYNKKENPVTLLYSCRAEEDFLFRSEIEQLFSVHDHWTLHLTVTQGDAKEGVMQGRLTPETARRYHKRLTDPLYFLCGPPAMIQDLIKALTIEGVDRDRILTEQYE